MNEHKIEPHRITKPIQLMAVWFVALLLLDSSFLLAAANITQPPWAAPTLVVSAIGFVLLFLVCIFLMQTKFRKELQDDQYYSQWLKRNEERFKGFKAENIQTPTNVAVNTSTKPVTVKKEDIERIRIKRYQDQKGLFLVHSWRPSTTPGQVADIVIWLHQHGEGPLTNGEIEKVEYQLGPKFFDAPQEKTNADEQYRIEVSAYGPLLCLAKVFLGDGAEPILLDRYVNFEDAPRSLLQRKALRHR